MAKSESKAEKKVEIESVEAGIAGLADYGFNVPALNAAIKDGLISAELDTVEIESGKYSGDYVKFSLGPKAVDEESIFKALLAISGGNLTAPNSVDDKGVVETDKEGNPIPDKKIPNLVKFTLYGADLNHRSRTSQKIKAAAEGPDKAIEAMAKNMVKAKPKLTMEQAREMVRAMLED